METTCLANVLLFSEQVHRGIKGVVRDADGNGIKGATVSIRGIRKDVTTGKYNSVVICHPFGVLECCFVKSTCKCAKLK